MAVHLEVDAASECVRHCEQFIETIMTASLDDRAETQSAGTAAFETALRIGAVYTAFAGEDLSTILGGFRDQAKAMSILFAAAGGLIEAHDEAVATALGKASAEPAGLQSLGLIAVPDAGSLGSLTGMLDAADDAVGGYERVGYENVDGATLDWMVSGAQALNPQEFAAIRERASAVATRLSEAGDALYRGLTDQLNGPWQGEFATQALASVTSFDESITRFAAYLGEVSNKATEVESGFGATQRQMTETAAAYDSARTSALAADATMPSLLPPSGDAQADLARDKAAAEQQARAIINREYSPAVMRGNLADLDIPTPYRVVALPTLGGPGGVDLVSAWNVDGVIRPATPGTPSAAALAAATGGGGGLGPAGGGAAGGAAIGATTTSPPVAPSDAATEQALLASRGGGLDGAGAIAASAGQAGAGGGVNASTTAAGAPFAPMATAGGQQSGAGGIRGIRGAGNSNRERSNDRGFGSAAGLVGGGGAAAAGAAASRLGGAGTLAGIGGGAGGSAGGAGAGAFGAGSASAGSAGTGAGAMSSSSSGGAQAGRAGAMPMGGMMGAAGAGQNSDRRGHTPAGYLTNATNTTAIIGDPLKVSPAVLGRKPIEDPSAHEAKPEPFRGRVIGRDYTGRGAK